MNEEDTSEHTGQRAVGTVATASVRRPCSVIWIWSTPMPSGKEKITLCRRGISFTSALPEENPDIPS
jgi:hypothetical protein